MAVNLHSHTQGVDSDTPATLHLFIYWLVGWFVYRQGINSQAGLKFVAIPLQPPGV